MSDHDEDLLLAAKGMRRCVQMPFLLAMSMGWYSLVSVSCACICWVLLLAFLNPSLPLPSTASIILGVVLAVAAIEGVIAAAITYALWFERAWSRDLVIAWWALTTLPAVFGASVGVGPGEV